MVSATGNVGLDVDHAAFLMSNDRTIGLTNDTAGDLQADFKTLLHLQWGPIARSLRQHDTHQRLGIDQRPTNGRDQAMDARVRSSRTEAAPATAICTDPGENRQPQQAGFGRQGRTGIRSEDDRSGCNIQTEATQRKDRDGEVSHHSIVTSGASSHFYHKGPGKDEMWHRRAAQSPRSWWDCGNSGGISGERNV